MAVTFETNLEDSPALNLRDLVAQLRSVLRAMPAESDGARKLEAVVGALDCSPVVKVGAAMELLGVASPDTVKNWARAGRFPGARTTPGGQWLFPLDEVLAHAQNRQIVLERTSKGDYSTPEVDRDPFTDFSS